eukprot:TRINITY_DN30977_c0_g1_i1.p1 TRINITY_DN30977_c0_g1~~TRINITY_DN30977_c0_g1_i1.p1  ORF type:complete len:270 (+),score=82.30 TRINITY_DN30977_c0_g1_i1:73-810(+)
MRRSLCLFAGRTRRVLLLGPTGAGKSCVGNLLLGRKVFDETAGFASPPDARVHVATRGPFGCGTFGDDDWEICDTVGFGDTGTAPREVTKALLKELHSEEGGPVDAALVVLRADQRFTADTARCALTAAGAVAAPGAERCCWVVLTHAPEELRSRRELRRWVERMAEALPEQSLAPLLAFVPASRWMGVDIPPQEDRDQRWLREDALDALKWLLRRQLDSGDSISVDALRDHIDQRAARRRDPGG